MSLQLQNNRKSVTASRRWLSKTLIAAYVVLGLVLWQAVHVVGGGERPFKRSEKLQMGSTKFLVDRNSPSRNNRPTKEPVAAFFERAKRGMTEQEIRGMIYDFEAIGTMLNIGLVDSGDPARLLKEWRLKALTEALSLSHEQKREVWDSLNRVHDWNQPERKTPLPIDNTELLVLELQKNSYRNFYLGNSYADTWSLGNLTEDQLQLTYKKSLEAIYKARWEEYKKSSSISCHGEDLLVMHDLESGGYVDYPPPSAMDLACKIHGSVLGGIINVTNTFPLTPDQKLADHRNDLLAQAKLLHPAQLRMALLMNPGVAETIKQQLDEPRE